MFDKVQEISNTISERIKSPFVGSFIITWSVIHWKIYILLFYNEPSLTIEKRIDNINTYLSNLPDYYLIVYPILFTLVVILGYTILNAISLFIKLGYEDRAKPYIQYIMDNKKIVLLSIHERIKKELIVVRNQRDEFYNNQIKSEEAERHAKHELENYKYNSINITKLQSIEDFFMKRTDYILTNIGHDNEIQKFAITFDFNGAIITGENNEAKHVPVMDVIQSLDGKHISCTWNYDSGKRYIHLLKFNESRFIGNDNLGREYIIQRKKVTK